MGILFCMSFGRLKTLEFPCVRKDLFHTGAGKSFPGEKSASRTDVHERRLIWHKFVEGTGS